MAAARWLRQSQMKPAIALDPRLTLEIRFCLKYSLASCDPQTGGEAMGLEPEARVGNRDAVVQ